MNETEHDRRRDELAAYLLGALEPGEAAELERHLAGCEECREELAWLRPAVQLLPEVVERVEPAPELRARLMGQVRSEADRPPAPASDREREPSPRRRFVTLRPAVGLAALALIVAAVAGYAIRGGGSDGGETSTVVSGSPPGVTVEMVSEGDSGTLHLANLPQLPPDEVLQAWVERDDRVVSAKTLFVPNRDGTATAVIDDMTGVDTVMVTEEPRGGSAQPTSAPVASISVPN